MLSVDEVINKCNEEVAADTAKVLVKINESKSVLEKCKDDIEASGNVKQLINSLASIKPTEDTNKRIDKLDAAIAAISEKSKPLRKSMKASIFSTESELLEVCALVAKETAHAMNGNTNIDPEETAFAIIRFLDNIEASCASEDYDLIPNQNVNPLLVLDSNDVPNMKNDNMYFEKNGMNKLDLFALRMGIFNKHLPKMKILASHNREKLFGNGENREIVDEIVHPAFWELSESPEFMLPLADVEKIEKTRKRPEKKMRQEKKEVIKLTNTADAKVQSEEVSIMKELKHVQKSLKKTLEKRNIDHIPYYEFVLNPYDFSRTVENMFYVSYLIRDQEIYLFYENKIPILKRAKSMDEGTKKKCSKEHVYHGIAQLSYNQWKELCKTYSYCCIEPKNI